MNPYFIIGSLLAVIMAFGAGYWQGDTSGQAKVQQKWDHERADQLAAYAKEQDKARETEQQLQAQADKLRKDKDAEIRNLNARATALANSLRDRPTRPADASQVPDPAGARPSPCTARELYREDAEVAVRLAREADEIRAALQQCYQQYNAAKAMK